jgi:hypothetical protein
MASIAPPFRFVVIGRVSGIKAAVTGLTNGGFVITWDDNGEAGGKRSGLVGRESERQDSG